MKRFSMLVVALALAVMVGCATQVTVTPTHRENMAAQSKVLAITARDLDGIVRARNPEGGGFEAVKAVIEFHAQAENFAGTVGEGRSDDKISSDYEHLIEAYVKLKRTFPNLNADKLTTDAYTRVQYEYEKLARTSGYANKAYQKKIEEGK
jgi:cytochrome c556